MEVKKDLLQVLLKLSSGVMVLYMTAAFLFFVAAPVPKVSASGQIFAQATQQTSGSTSGIQNDGLVPCGNGGTPENPNPNPCTIDAIFVVIAKVTNFLIVAAGAYAVLMIIISAFRMVTARGDQGALTKAKNGLTYAIIGFVLVMIAFAAVNTFVYKIFGVSGASLIGNPFDVGTSK